MFFIILSYYHQYIFIAHDNTETIVKIIHTIVCTLIPSLFYEMKFMLAARKPNFAEAAHTTLRFSKPRFEGKYRE